jgi:cysteine desulfurase/selenocysteine lyase
MTIPEILSNEELRLREFPVAREKIYLAHAGVCPLPARVADAVKAYSTESTQDDQEVRLASILRETRSLAARVVQAQPEEIALLGPTTLALSYIAGGLPFRKNDNVLIYFDDYPSNVYPWMSLAEKGVEVRFMNIKEWGRIRAVDVIGQVDENTKMVALASCHFVAGWRIDLAGIGKELRDRNILFCVDGIQTVGAFPTPAEYFDFLAADAHKWMLGPCASGIMYVRKDMLERIHPVVQGWNNVKCPNYIAQEEMVFRRDAQRFEAGTHNLLGIIGLKAALELILEIGVENISAELRRKRAWFVPALQEKGYTVIHADAPAQHQGGIITIHRGTEDLTSLHLKLATANIVTSLRSDRAGKKYIRLSPHFYNTDAELKRVLEML